MKRIRLVLTILAVFLVIFFSYSQIRLYQGIKREVDNEISKYNDLFAAATYSKLHEIEIILDFLGSELIYKDTYKNPEKTQRYLTMIRAQIDSTAGFALLSPDGRYLAISMDITPEELPNIAEQEETKEGFANALTSARMVVGRVHFFKPTHEWVLPLRKALRDASGKVIGVLAIGLIVDKTIGFWAGEPLYPGQISTITTRAGLWRLYIHPLDKKDYERVFTNAVPRRIYDQMIVTATTKYQVTPDKLRNRKSSFTLETTSAITGKSTLLAAQYIDRYALWITSSLPEDIPKILMFQRGFTLKVILLSLSILIFIGFTIFIIRIEEKAKRELAYQASHDSLTGLKNRSSLEGIIQKWTGLNAIPFTFLFFDLDSLKNINDSFGHSCGDLILIEVAQRLRDFARQDWEVARIGGDEFAIMLRISNINELSNTVSQLIEKISEHYLISGMKLHIGASVGISRFPEDGMTFEKIMISADLAMHEAKKKRNSYAFYDTEIQEVMLRKMSIENQLRNALDNNELYIVFQPQISKDKKIKGAEALVRWKNPELGFVPPDQFISVAEESGLITKVGTYIIEQTCAEFSRIIRDGNNLNASMSVSINVSVKQILEGDFKDKLLEAIDRYELRYDQIILEITESVFIDELDYILSLLKEIRKTGIFISLDDFGTGYSSLSMLRILPINELKIDRSFVNSITSISQDSNMTKSIIDIGHTMNMHVLAEGVENEEQLHILQQHNCDIYQGYYFSKPITTDEFIAYIKNYEV